MRQNLTNVKEIDIKDVEHFYVVGSVTKDGLLEGKSNVKLDLKKAASGGGGASSEDAERMYEALFGQVPYLSVGPKEKWVLVPLYEAFTTGIVTEISASDLYYKSSTPVPKATFMNMEDGVTTISFPLSSNIYMMEVPTEVTGMPDTWYVPLAYDINLVGYTTPTEGNPTIVSGTLPDKREMEALMHDHIVTGVFPTDFYYWGSNINAFVMDVESDYYYALRQSDNNVIEWSYNHREIPPA